MSTFYERAASGLPPGPLKTCTGCLQDKPEGEFYKRSDRDAYRSQCKSCSRPVNAARARERHQRLLGDVFAGYGGKCSCCGEAEYSFLTLDHVNNDGAQHRRELQAQGIMPGAEFYKWIIDNDFPDLLQVLCGNCQYSKMRNFGICVHVMREA